MMTFDLYFPLSMVTIVIYFHFGMKTMGFPFRLTAMGLCFPPTVMTKDFYFSFSIAISLLSSNMIFSVMTALG